MRVSEKDPKFPYTMVILHKGHVNNLRIRRRDDNKFALGEEKSDEMVRNWNIVEGGAGLGCCCFCLVLICVTQF